MADSEATRAEKKLAALLLVEADLAIEPEQVRALIREHWGTIAPLAHIIHEGPDYTKSGNAVGGSGSAGVRGGLTP